MFLSIKKFNVQSQDEVIKKVQAGLLPTIKNLPGFINFYATKFDDGDLGSVSIFASKPEADKAADIMTSWTKSNLAVHLPKEPMLFRGEVVFSGVEKTIARSA